MEAPTAASNGSAPPSGAMAPSQSDFEASVVGPPPSLARAIESGKEHSAAMRRTSEGPEVRSRMRDGQLPTLVISGTALIALAFAVFFYIRPNQSQVAPQPVQATQTAAIAQQSTAAAQGTAQAQASPQNTVPPPVVLETVVPGQPKNATSGNHAIASTGAQTAVKPVPTIAASAAARVATQATLRASSTTPAPRAATPHPAQIAQAPKPTAAPHPHPRSRRPVGASPNRIVDIQGIGAHYGPAGHAVRVAWGASGQASAHVELFDDRGGTLSQTDVVGTRQSAVLYVPQSYHGAVTVQVVSVGALGERVTQSTSLPAFSH